MSDTFTKDNIGPYNNEFGRYGGLGSLKMLIIINIDLSTYFIYSLYRNSPNIINIKY